MKRQLVGKPKPVTAAQKIFGRAFDNTRIINERPAELRSNDPKVDKILFKEYKRICRQQTRVIRACRTGRIDLKNL